VDKGFLGVGGGFVREVLVEVKVVVVG
jgi:hypothetical protein